MDRSPPGSSVPGDTPGKNTGVGLHSLLQGLLLTQGLNTRLLHCRQILYFLSHQGSPNQTIALTPIPCCFPGNTWDHQGSWCNSGVTSGPTSNSLHMTPALDWEGRTRALQAGLLHPCFCSFWGWRVPPQPPAAPGIDVFKRKLHGSPERFPSEAVPADGQIHSQSWLMNWWESETVRNSIRRKAIGQVHILHSPWLPSKRLVSRMETSFLNSVMVLSSGAATVSKLHSSTRKLFSAFVRETGLLYCLCYCKNNRIVFITDIPLEIIWIESFCYLWLRVNQVLFCFVFFPCKCSFFRQSWGQQDPG